MKDIFILLGFKLLDWLLYWFEVCGALFNLFCIFKNMVWFWYFFINIIMFLLLSVVPCKEDILISGYITKLHHIFSHVILTTL